MSDFLINLENLLISMIENIIRVIHLLLSRNKKKRLSKKMASFQIKKIKTKNWKKEKK